MKRYGSILIPLIALGVSGRPAPASAEMMSIVVSEASVLQDISLDGLREVFLLDVIEIPGTREKVKFISMPDKSPAQKVALSVIYKMSGPDLKRRWLKKVFRNEIATEPQTVNSADELKGALAGLKGGIGYCLQSEVPPGLRTVRVNGKLPGESGYPLVE